MKNDEITQELDALVDRVAHLEKQLVASRIMVDPNPAPKPKPEYDACSVHYSVGTVCKPSGDPRYIPGYKDEYRVSILPDNQHLSRTQATEIVKGMVEKSHLPVRIVGWQSIPGPLDKPEILIGQQLYARTSGELSEKLVKEWRFSKGLPKFVKDDLDILRREFE